MDSTVKELNALAADRGWDSDVGGPSSSGSASSSSRAVGLAANVALAADVAALADFAAETLGSVDLWINNAGTCSPWPCRERRSCHCCRR